MIEINYNEYKETIADNMKLIQENHKLKEIIKEVRELLSQEWYTVLRKKTIKQVLEILDKENNNEDN